MADGRHHEKLKNRHISAEFRAISPKFGTQTQFDPLERQKLAISLERFADFHEIWYGDAYSVAEWDRKLKFPTFENPRWRTAAILKNRKSAISPERFDRSLRNLVR